VLTGVTGILGAGLLQATVAGATEPWQSSADGTITTYRSVDTGSELPFLVPAGVTSLDVAVLSGEQAAEDAAPAPQQLVVTPGSTLVFDLGHDDELPRPMSPAPGDSVEPAPFEDVMAEVTAPASWYVSSGTGVAASIRVADPVELAAEDGAAAPAEDLRGQTPGNPVEVPTVVAGQDGEAAAQDGPEDDAPVSVVVSFTVPTPGVLPVELQAAEWLAPAGGAADEPAVPAEVTDLAEDSVPIEPSVPSESPASADVQAPMGTAVDGKTLDRAETPVDASTEVEIPVVAGAPAASEASAPEDAPAPVEVPVLIEAPAAGEAPALVESPAPVGAPEASETPTPTPTPAPAPAEATTPASAPADTTIAAEPAAPVVTEAPATAEAPENVVLPLPTAPATSSSPAPTSPPRRDVPTPVASPSAVAVEPSAAPQPAGQRVAVDLQTASSTATADLLDADGVGILAASLVGVVVLGVGVTVTVGVRRRD
jgi:hypothetical protein